MYNLSATNRLTDEVSRSQEEWSAKAREDKTRFEDEMKAYNAKQESEEEVRAP